MCSKCGHEHGFYGCLVNSCECREGVKLMSKYNMLCKDCKQELPEDSTEIHICNKKETNVMKKISKKAAKKVVKKEQEMSKTAFSGNCVACTKSISKQYEFCYACKFYGEKSYSLRRKDNPTTSTRVNKEMQRRAKFDKETRKLEA